MVGIGVDLDFPGVVVQGDDAAVRELADAAAPHGPAAKMLPDFASEDVEPLVYHHHLARREKIDDVAADH